jgi:hypothetical protein
MAAARVSPASPDGGFDGPVDGCSRTIFLSFFQPRKHHGGNPRQAMPGVPAERAEISRGREYTPQHLILEVIREFVQNKNRQTWG